MSVCVLFSGHIHLLWLRKVGATQEGGLQVRIQIPGRQRTLERLSLSLVLSLPLYLSLFHSACVQNTVFILRKVGKEAFRQVRLRTTNFGIYANSWNGHGRRLSLPCSVKRDSVLGQASQVTARRFVVVRRRSFVVWSTFLGGSHHGLSSAICDWKKCLTSVNYVGFTCSWPQGLGFVSITRSLHTQTFANVRVQACLGNFCTKTYRSWYCRFLWLKIVGAPFL